MKAFTFIAVHCLFPSVVLAGPNFFSSVTSKPTSTSLLVNSSTKLTTKSKPAPNSSVVSLSPSKTAIITPLSSVVTSSSSVVSPSTTPYAIPSALNGTFNYVLPLLNPNAQGLSVPCANRGFWGSLDATFAAKKIASGNPFLTKQTLFNDSIYANTMNSAAVENMINARNSELNLLVMAECIEFKGRFLPGNEWFFTILTK